MTTSLLKFAGAAAALLMVSACAGSTVEGPDLNADQRGDGQIVQTGPAAGSQEHLEQNAGHRVFFGYNQYTLTAQAQATLARQADWLKGNPGVGVTLAGNADERGTREYNLALGARRAEAARAYLFLWQRAATRSAFDRRSVVLESQFDNDYSRWRKLITAFVARIEVALAGNRRRFSFIVL